MEFFEKLPEFTSLLELEINAENQDLQLDFGAFLFRMTNLFFLKTDQSLKVDFVRDLIQRLRFLNRIQFKANGQEFIIKKLDKDQYKLKTYNANENHFYQLQKGVKCENLISYLKNYLDEPINDKPTSDFNSIV